MQITEAVASDLARIEEMLTPFLLADIAHDSKVCALVSCLLALCDVSAEPEAALHSVFALLQHRPPRLHSPLLAH